MTNTTWNSWLTERLSDLLDDPETARTVVDEPDRDLFAAGMDSLRSFRLLDDLAEAGVDIDFVDLVQTGTITFVLEQIADAGIARPPA